VLLASSQLESANCRLQVFHGYGDSLLPRTFASALAGVIVQFALEDCERFLDVAQLIPEVPRVDSRCRHNQVAYVAHGDAGSAWERLAAGLARAVAAAFVKLAAPHHVSFSRIRVAAGRLL
jgi:hypothetical protein